ncbi:MAG: transposase [Geopsychrobacter sp.]|nr:transposase [Geopsychrobacter sp.]
MLSPTESSLSHFMRRLLSGYAVTFNLRHKRSGHLFQNRYKSIVCDDETYLLELVRYIHLNPVRAKIVDRLEDLDNYRWCGHRQFIGKPDFHFIKEDEILPLFSKRKKTAVLHYRQFLADGLQDKKQKLSRGGRIVSQAYDASLGDDDDYDDRILGGGEFIEQVLSAAQNKIDAGLSINQLVSEITTYYNIADSDLSLPCRQPIFVRAKAVICYLAIRHYHFSGVSIAARLGYSTSAVSRAASRGQKLFKKDAGLHAFLGKADL